MDPHEQLKKHYLEAISHWKDREDDALMAKLDSDADDEAVFHQIAINILELFEKAFFVAYGAVFRDGDNPKLKPVIQQYADPNHQLKAAVQVYFDELTTPWKTKAVADEAAGDIEGWKKESVKVEVARMLEGIFHKLSAEYLGVNGHAGHKH